MMYGSMHDLRVDLNPKGGGIFTDLTGEITDLVGSYREPFCIQLYDLRQEVV